MTLLNPKSRGTVISVEGTSTGQNLRLSALRPPRSTVLFVALMSASMAPIKLANNRAGRIFD